MTVAIVSAAGAVVVGGAVLFVPAVAEIFEAIVGVHLVLTSVLFDLLPAGNAGLCPHQLGLLHPLLLPPQLRSQ